MKSDAVRLGPAYTNWGPSVVESDVALTNSFICKFSVAFTLQSNLFIAVCNSSCGKVMFS